MEEKKAYMNIENNVEELYPSDDIKHLVQTLIPKIEKKIGSPTTHGFAGDWLKAILNLSKNTQTLEKENVGLYTGIGGNLYLVLLLHFSETEKLKNMKLSGNLKLNHEIEQQKQYCEFIFSEMERLSFICLGKLNIPLQIVSDPSKLVDVKQRFLKKYSNFDNCSFLDGKFGVLVLLSVSFSEMSSKIKELYDSASSTEENVKEDFESKLGDVEKMKNFLISLKNEFAEVVIQTPDLEKYSQSPEKMQIASFRSNELLYGRAGFLWGIEFYQNYLNYCHNFGSTATTSPNQFLTNSIQHLNLVHEITRTIIRSGLVQTRFLLDFYEFEKEAIVPHEDVLIFHWHGRDYIGGIHGTSGILFVLNGIIMNYMNNLPNSKTFESSKQFHKEIENFGQDEIILSYLTKNLPRTVEFLINLQFENTGNFPSRNGNTEDRLVQFCHGPLGPIALFCQILENFDFFSQFLFKSEQNEAEKTKKIGEFATKIAKSLQKSILCVWNRGILRKGFGICHGIAGNCYSFLWFLKMLSKLQKNSNSPFSNIVISSIEKEFQIKDGKISDIFETWSKRMIKFASFMIVHPETSEKAEKEWQSIQISLLSTPDHPYSLFEGVSGSLVFLSNLKNNLSSSDNNNYSNWFPCFADFPFPRIL